MCVQAKGMMYLCYSVDDKFIRLWVAPPNEKNLERHEVNQGFH